MATDLSEQTERHPRARGAVRRVMILAGDTDRDLGARATILGLCGAFHHADPAVEITLVSGRADLAPAPGIANLIPRGPAGLSRFIKSVGTQDLVIVINGVYQDTHSRPTLPYRAARLNLFNLLSRNLRAHALSPRSTPDPAFALAPASPEAAAAYLRTLGIDPDRPLIGVAVRRRPQEHRFSFLPPGVRARIPPMANSDSDDDSGATRLLQQVADATAILAGRRDAGVLLMPVCRDRHEDDGRYCHELAGMLQGPDVRVASIDDPRLYKAVCGRLELMISARTHPLILAAGMGVPGVALGNGGIFEGIFDTLGLPRRLISFDEYREGQAERLVVLGQSALDHPGGLREQADFLRQRVMHEAASLLGRRVRIGPAAAGSSQ